MAQVERVLLGSRAQVLAAAYASVATRGHFVERFDFMAGKFTFTKFGCGFLEFSVAVTVDEEDDLHSRVTVKAFRVGDGFRLERLARRIATRYLDRVQGEWAKPLRAYCEPGWYSDVTGRFPKRYWDGQLWTPWVWWRDTLLLDHPTGGGNWFTLHRKNTRVTPQPVVIITELHQKWLPPPLYREGHLWSRPQRWRYGVQLGFARRPRAWAAALLLVVLAIAILTYAYFTEPDRYRSRPAAASEPSGLALGSPGAGLSGAWVKVNTVKADQFKLGDSIVAYVFVEVCAGDRRVRIGPDFVTVEAYDGALHDGMSSDLEPRLKSGYVKEHDCQSGWVAAPIGWDVYGRGPRSVEWRGDGWHTTRWAV